MRLLLLFAICLVSFSFTAMAQQLASTALYETPETEIEAFFGYLAADDIDSAFTDVIGGTQIGTVDPESLPRMAEQLTGMVDRYGAFLGTEQYLREEFGDSLLRLVYISRFEQYPIFWDFRYYKSDGKWELISIKFNVDTEYLRPLKAAK